jgi:hypothetical protein
MFLDGYWVEVCRELRSSNSTADLAYYIEMNHSNQVYTRLAKDSKMRTRLFEKCNFSDEEIEAKEKLLEQNKEKKEE